MPRPRHLAPALACAALALAAVPAAAGAGPSPETVDLLRDAVARGFGDTCDLAGRKAERDGYFRCIDVGPYRFSFGDRTLRGYVVLKDAEPFPFMEEGGDGTGGYTVGGPWERDLDRRVEGWYSDEVQGGRVRREAERADADRARAAGEAVEAYGGRNLGPTQAAPPASYAPNPYAPGPYAPGPYATGPQSPYQAPAYPAQGYAPQPYPTYPPQGAPGGPDASPLLAPSGPAARPLAPGAPG